LIQFKNFHVIECVFPNDGECTLIKGENFNKN